MKYKGRSINNAMCYEVQRTLHKLSVAILLMPIPVGATSKTCLRPLVCWDYAFEYRRGHGYLSVVSAVCCQVEVFATGRSPAQIGPTECGVSECDRENS